MKLIHFLKLNLMMFSFLCIAGNVHAEQTIVVGDPHPKHIWVFLPGLLNEFDASQSNLKDWKEVLQHVGEQSKTQFIVVKQNGRCAEFENRLCWLQSNQAEVKSTYEYIKKHVPVKLKKVDGFVGFSNGAYYLANLMQHVHSSKPMVVIGGGDREVSNAPLKTKEIIILIGKEDASHAQHAFNLEKHAQEAGVNVRLIEYKGGHVLPAEELLEIVK